MIDLSMTRYELIQAFRKIAQVLFLDGHDEIMTLHKVKAIVIDVLTENESPIVFGSDDKTGGI